TSSRCGPRIMAGALSDAAWAAICTAAESRPDAGTRERLSTIFEQYPVFTYDPKRTLAIIRRSERMLRQLDAFAAGYHEQFSGDDDVQTEHDLWCIAAPRRRVEAVWLAACAIRRAHRGHQNVQREWLYNQLCTVWLWDFHAPELTVRVPPLGGPPYGPLIAFLLAAIREVVSEEELPSPYALRDAIRRERDERQTARQLGLFLEKRRPMPA